MLIGFSAAKRRRMDGKHEDSAAPNSVVLSNLWIVPWDFRSFRDARPNLTEMDNLNLKRTLQPVLRFSSRAPQHCSVPVQIRGLLR